LKTAHFSNNLKNR